MTWARRQTKARIGVPELRKDSHRQPFTQRLIYPVANWMMTQRLWTKNLNQGHTYFSDLLLAPCCIEQNLSAGSALAARARAAMSKVRVGHSSFNTVFHASPDARVCIAWEFVLPRLVPFVLYQTKN
jgi:hypothetical protein